MSDTTLVYTVGPDGAVDHRPPPPREHTPRCGCGAPATEYLPGFGWYCHPCS